MTTPPTPIPSVWLVERGLYSDRCVVGVFSTRALADEFIATYQSSSSWEHEPVEVPLNAHLHARGLTRYDVRISRHDSSICSIERHHDHRVDDTDSVRTRVWARDVEHALKIASERRAQYLANLPPPLLP